MTFKKVMPAKPLEPQAQLNNGRRRAPRRSIEKQIGLLVSGQYHLAMVFELGEGGMLIDSPVVLKKDQKVVITLRIPGVLKTVSICTVVYGLENHSGSGHTRYGLQFDNLEFEVKRKIRFFVASSVSEGHAKVS